MCRCIKEWFSKVFPVPLRHWLELIAIVWGVGGVFSCIIWFFGGGKETFWSPISYIFVCISILIAITAAWSSIIASIITSKSLELTRATTRPFLTFSEVNFYTVWTALHKGPAVKLVLRNTGSLPAKEVSAELELFQLEKKEDTGERPIFYQYNDRKIIFHHKSNLSIYFPGEESPVSFFLKPEIWNEIVTSRKTLMEIKIKYQFEQKEYKLVRTLFLRTFEKSGRPTIAPEFVPGSDLSD